MGNFLIVIGALAVFYLAFKNSMSPNQKIKRGKINFKYRPAESDKPFHNEVIPPSEESMNISSFDDVESGTDLKEICPFCNRIVQDTGKFCPFCGYSLEEIQESLNNKH